MPRVSRGVRRTTTQTANDAAAIVATAMGAASGAFLWEVCPRGPRDPCLRLPGLAAAPSRPLWAVEMMVETSALRAHLAAVAALALGVAAAAVMAAGGVTVALVALKGTAVLL